MPEHVLAAAGIGSLFEARIDGVVAEALGLAGKPDPESFLEAARRLNTLPARSVVIEDAVAGVEAGRSGGFGLVIGIGPPENALDLRSRGADVVVENLGAPHPGLGFRPKPHRGGSSIGPELNPLPEGTYPVDEWRIVEHGLSAELSGRMETIFALSNGYFGIRGTPDEMVPVDEEGTFVNGFYESWPIVYPEAAFGFANTGQTIVNVPDATTVQLSVDGDTLDIGPRRSTRTLDMRRGILEREAAWLTESGKTVTVRSERLVSLEHRHIAAIRWEVTGRGRTGRDRRPFGDPQQARRRRARSSRP